VGQIDLDVEIETCFFLASDKHVEVRGTPSHTPTIWGVVYSTRKISEEHAICICM
jgi:hypothetical protein